MEALLECTRRVKQAIRHLSDDEAGYDDLAGALSAILDCDVCIIGSDGAALGSAYGRSTGCVCHDVPSEQAWIVNNISDTIMSHEYPQLECPFDRDKHCSSKSTRSFAILPLSAGTHRLGTLIIERKGRAFNHADMAAAEYAASAVSLELLRREAEGIEDQVRQRVSAEMAVRALSYSEAEAVLGIFERLGNTGGNLVAGKVAKELGVTRSVLINALRKLQSAGVIESKSLGMKGTYVKVLNPLLMEKLTV